MPAVAPDAPLEAWGDTAWLIAQLDAWEAMEFVRRALAVHARIDAGKRWMAEHDKTHPKYRRSRALMHRLRFELDMEILGTRCYVRDCWFRCVEAHGFWSNAGVPTRTPEEMFAELLPGQEVPELTYINGCLTVDPLRAVAPWQMDAYRELLDAKLARGVKLR